MPPPSPAALLHVITSRNATAQSPFSCAASDDSCIEVFCGWPLSGQYGLGQRLLYYILLAVCVPARRKEWIRNVCIAAALLVPAVAAIHGIVLAALHVDGAIDMDLYGALQFCSIGILAVPITVKESETFFKEKGRNTVYVWTGLLLAGLLSLAVEFYRSNAIACYHDNLGNPISSNPKKFPYGGDALCGLTCSQQEGPFSPLRRKAASEIFVVPRPDELRFGNAMFLAAACCLPAIISLVSMRNKIVITDWIKRQGSGTQDEHTSGSESAKDANAAESGKPTDLYRTFRGFLRLVEIFVFGGAVLAILILGEINFFSPQMEYHTEPFGSVGQWGTIVATGLAAFGSFLIYLLDDKKESPPKNPMAICGCDHCREIDEKIRRPEPEMMRSSTDGQAEHIEDGLFTLTGATTAGTQGHDPGHRRKISRGLVKVGTWFGTTTEDPFGAPDDRRTGWPELPGEYIRNPNLAITSDQFSTYREIEPPHTPVSQEYHSGSEGGSMTPRAVSPTSQEPPVSPTSPTHELAASKRRYNSEPICSFPSQQRSGSPSLPTDRPGGGQNQRRQTLEVPGQPPRAHRRS